MAYAESGNASRGETFAADTPASENLKTTAPNFPFSGMINYYSSYHDTRYDGYISYPKGSILQFWNTRTKELSSVFLGDDLVICGAGKIQATIDGAYLSYLDYNYYGSTALYIPWGDDSAYPSLVHPQGRWDAGPKLLQVSDEFSVEQPVIDVGTFRISTSTQSQFYELDYYRGLIALRSDYSITDIPARLSDWEVEHFSYNELSGTDGRHYGLRFVFYEPACGDTLTYVMSAETGELMICGLSLFAPQLVDFDNVSQSDAAITLPRVFPSDEQIPCYHATDLFYAIDLRELLQ